MLALPPKMQNALDAGRFNPVGAVKITTGLLDAPPSSQTWVDTGGNLINTAQKYNVQQSYPDPSATAPIVNRAYPFSGGETPGESIGTNRFVENIPYTTFTLGEDVQNAWRVKDVSVLLKRGSTAISGKVRAAIAPVTDDGILEAGVGSRGTARGLIAGSIISPTEIDTSTISAGTPSAHTFSFEVDLIPQKKYALVLYEHSTANGNPIWVGKTGANPFGEYSIRFNRNPSEGETYKRLPFGLSLRINAYQYDSTPPPILQIQYDLGAIPLSSGEWDLQDRPATMIDPVSGLPQTTSISYHAWSTDATFVKGTGVDLGVIDQNNPDIAVLSRYYLLEISFTTTPNGLRTHAFLGATPKFASIQSGEPASYIFSTKQLPFSEAPALEKIPTISFRLNPGKPITERANTSVSLIDLGGVVTRRLMESNIKNLPFEVMVGNDDALSENDMLTVFSGQVTGFEHEEGRTTVSAEDSTTKFKQRIPRIEPVVGDNGQFAYDTTDFRRIYESQEIITSVEHLLRAEGGFREKEIDSQSFEDLRTALKAGATVSPWITNLKVKEETELDDLIKEAMLLARGYLVVREEGKVVAIQFPRLGTSVAAWGDDEIATGDVQPESWKATQKNAVYVQYDALGDGEGKGRAGYYDLAAQLDWAPGSARDVSDMVIKNRWLGPEDPFNGETVAKQVAKAIVQSQKNGLLIYQCRTSFRQIAVQVGDLVDVTTKTFLKKGVLGAKGVQMMVIGKSFSGKADIRFLLVENIVAEQFPTASFTAAPMSGLPTLNVTVDGSGSFDNNTGGSITTWEWDKDYNGSTFNVDATGVTPPPLVYDSTSVGVKVLALRVTNTFGGQHISKKTVRVLGPPVAVIASSVSAPDQPLSLTLRSASYGVTGRIILTEWDLSYDGSFNSEVVGSSAIVTLPYQNLTIALRETDEDGLVSLTTSTFSGKTFAPADVAGFFVDQVGDKLVFHWDNNLDKDILGYEIRCGSSWTNSIEVGSEIQTNSFTTVAPTTPGSKTFLISAINTTGRRSINATSIVINVFDNRDRNIVVSKDYKAEVWPGTLSGLVREGATNDLWIGSTDDPVSAMTNAVSTYTGVIGLRGTRVSGYFEGVPVDLGAVISGVRLSVDTDSRIIPDPVGTVLKTEYSESDDGVGYSAFAQVSQSDKDYRFAKPKITLSNSDGVSNIGLSALTSISDVPDVLDSGSDEVIAVGGKTVSYNRNFNSVPAVTSITIQNMALGLYGKLTNKTATGFDVQIFRASDNVDVGGTIDWAVKGY